jgi:formylglycine-generating enzyme required for sulfatase activity
MRCFHLFHGRWTRSRVLSVAAGALTTVASFAAPSCAAVVSFGSGAGNTFDMEFVTIGNPGNAADSDPSAQPLNAGAVGYAYGIGKFEVSRDMITKYNSNFGTANSLVISLEDMSGYGGNGANRPATGVSWNEAARFVNWLNTSTGGVVAYNYANSTIDTNLTPWTSADSLDYDASNPYRSKRAKYFLPSYNEWYKAAYYSPSGTYYDYATGSDTAPGAVASGTTAGTAVYNFQSGPADVTQAGGLSPYSVMGLGGNVFEWEESSFDLANSSGSSNRYVRGGSWQSFPSDLSSSSRGFATAPSDSVSNYGFRVASLSSDAAVPEPSMMVIGTLFGIGGLMTKRRMKK